VVRLIIAVSLFLGPGPAMGAGTGPFSCSTADRPCVQDPAADASQEGKVEANSPEPEPGWVSLFNGTDLTGWTPKIRGCEAGDNFANTFRVVDGVLQVNYDGYESFDDRFGHLFFNGTFSHYRLRIEYRFLGEQVAGGPGWAWRNSGVMLHGQSPESMTREQSFPVSIEAQFLGGNGTEERPTLNLCTPGTHVVMNGELIRRHCTDSTSATIHGDDWVLAEIEVHGDRLIRHLVNGEAVLEYNQPQYDPDDADAKPLIKDGELRLATGTISLQSESHPIEFRRVELQELPVEEEGR
jgi:Domain of Unknown Function (DUF1080)